MIPISHPPTRVNLAFSTLKSVLVCGGDEQISSTSLPISSCSHLLQRCRGRAGQLTWIQLLKSWDRLQNWNKSWRCGCMCPGEIIHCNVRAGWWKQPSVITFSFGWGWKYLKLSSSFCSLQVPWSLSVFVCHSFDYYASCACFCGGNCIFGSESWVVYRTHANFKYPCVALEGVPGNLLR